MINILQGINTLTCKSYLAFITIHIISISLPPLFDCFNLEDIHCLYLFWSLMIVPQKRKNKNYQKKQTQGK